MTGLEPLFPIHVTRDAYGGRRIDYDDEPISDPIEALSRKAAGQRLASVGINPSWSRLCDDGIKKLARSGESFVAADLYTKADVPVPPSPKWTGVRISQASRKGWIRVVGVEASVRPATRGALVRRWIGTGAQ